MKDMTVLEGLTDEFIGQFRVGESPSVDDYAAKYPEWAEEIRELFPAALMMERLKRRKEFGHTSKNGEVMLGGRRVKQLGDYRILRELGRGGMGIVYEAEQTSLGRRVALKVLRDTAFSDSKKAKRFQLEARAAARLHHTNIVPVFGVGEQDGVHYYVMQYIHGHGLDAVVQWLDGQYRADATQASAPDVPITVHNVAQTMTIEQAQNARPIVAASGSTGNGKTSPGDLTALDSAAPIQLDSSSSVDVVVNRREDAPPAPQLADMSAGRAVFNRVYWQNVARIGRDSAEALHYAHAQGTLHRDIKPGNLILDTHGTVWITDFGLAKLAEMDKVTRTGDIVGTFRYMAPEQFDGQCDVRTDVYSLGLTLYELATLRPAFDQPDHAQLLHQITHSQPPRPRVVSPDLPRDLETIILKAIARDPSDRYQTAEQLADDLNSFLEDKPIKARQAGPAERMWRWCRRNPAVAIPTTLALLLLVVVAVVSSVAFVQTRAAFLGEAKQRETAESERQRAEQSFQSAQSERLRAEENLTKADRERRRAESNLALSLQAFEEIRDLIAPRYLVPTDERASTDEQFEPEFQPAVTKKDAALLESMLKFYDQFAENNNTDPHLQTEAALAHRFVGDIHQRLAQFRKAERAYQRALEIYEQLAADKPVEHPHRTDIAAVHNELGITIKMTGRDADAQKHHYQALEILREQLAAAPNSTQINLELVRTHNFLGYSIWGGNWRNEAEDAPKLITKAEENHRQALALLEKLIAEEPSNPDYQLMMARSYRDIAPVLFFSKFRENPQEAARDAEEATSMAIHILEDLSTQFPSVPQYRYELMRILLPSFRRTANDADMNEAERRCRRALELAEELTTEFPTVSEYSSRYASAHSRLGSILLQAGRTADAEEHLRQAVGLHQAQIRRYPDVPQYQMYLAMAQSRLSEMFSQTDRVEEARDALLASIALQEQMPTTLPTNRNRRMARQMLSWQYQKLSEIYTRLGETELADQAGEKANQLRAPRSGRPPGQGPSEGNSPRE